MGTRSPSPAPHGAGKRGGPFALVMAGLVALAAAGGVGTYISEVGVQQVAQHEGLRYTSYPDPGTGGAPWTVCYGSTRGVRPGMILTHEECLERLAADLWEAERAVQRNVKVPLRQGEYDAYVSFVFNVGEGNFRTSTMLRLLNSGDRTGACNQFPLWKYANKLVLNGLVVRRHEEQSLCLQEGPYVYPQEHRTGVRNTYHPPYCRR